jgi:sensor histidine kinase YesM
VSKFRNYWLGLPIGSKMKAFILPLLLVVLIAAGFNIYTIQFSVVDISNILEEISRCENAQDAMTNEEAAFHVFVRDPSVESLSDLNKAAVHSHSALSLLPYDYEEIGAERFAWTWRVKNAYQNYSSQRDLICASLFGSDSSVPDSEQEWVDQLYQVYDMQSYLSSYLQSLSQLTVGYASDVYDLKYPMIQSIPYFQAIFFLLLILVSLSFVGYLTRTILTPIEKLASASRSISQGQLEETDIQVSNRDELGELVDSFNRMKHATKKNIQTLEENQRLAEQLHKEEMERAEMEKRLETTRMDLLQSQIKPHFLFNTLNTISGMAELEDAEKTDSMICSLSRLFRYNLHTTDQFVSFSQELDVVRDYLYLQKMRFGDRVQYELPDPEGPEAAAFGNVMVPVFLLQPLVENAVIHGIAKKEQGGKITISTGQTDDALKICVADTGAGMNPDTLQGLMKTLRGEPSDVRVGIGIGNLYKRLETLYGPGSMQISSTAGKGTQVDITIPLGM